MKTIAILEVEEAREFLEHLNKKSIPTEIVTRTQASGLEITEIKVPNNFYGRGCDLVEAWNAEQIAEAKRRIRLNLPRLSGTAEQLAKRKRIGMLWFLVPAFFGFLVMLIDSIARIKSGDTAVDYNVFDQPVGPIMRLILSVVALPVTVVIIWQTFRRMRQKDNSDDKQTTV